MLVLAHRGVHEEAPENTIEAFQAAARLGVDGIETDLRFDRDGQPLLHHDALAPDGSPVATLGRAALARLAGHPVPTLAEGLEAAPTLLWNVEVKTPADPLAVLAALRPHLARRRLLITSFDHELMARLDELLPAAPALALGLLGEAPFPADLLPRGRLRVLAWRSPALDAARVGSAAGLGWAQIAWGAGDAEDHRRLARAGVQGIITDWPRRVPGFGVGRAAPPPGAALGL